MSDEEAAANSPVEGSVEGSSSGDHPSEKSGSEAPGTSDAEKEIARLKAQVAELESKGQDSGTGTDAKALAELEKILGMDVDLMDTDEAQESGEERSTNGKGKTPDFSKMSTKDVVSYLQDAMDEKVSRAVATITAQVEKRETVRQIKEFAAKTPDFKDHWNAIVEIGRRLPAINIEDAYWLAKTQKMRRESREGGKKGSPESERPHGGRTLTLKDAGSIREAASLAAKELGITHE